MPAPEARPPRPQQGSLTYADPGEALVQECQAIAERVRANRRHAEHLRALAEHAEALATRDEQILEELEAALGMSSQLRIEDLDHRLRGQRLEEIAIDLLRRERDVGEAIHYREWFALIERAGHHVAGRDPLATFLTQVRRSGQVEAVGRRSGRYRLRAS